MLGVLLGRPRRVHRPGGAVESVAVQAPLVAVDAVYLPRLVDGEGRALQGDDEGRPAQGRLPGRALAPRPRLDESPVLPVRPEPQDDGVPIVGPDGDADGQLRPVPRPPKDALIDIDPGPPDLGLVFPFPPPAPPPKGMDDGRRRPSRLLGPRRMKVRKASPEGRIERLDHRVGRRLAVLQGPGDGRPDHHPALFEQAVHLGDRRKPELQAQGRHDGDLPRADDILPVFHRLVKSRPLGDRLSSWVMGHGSWLMGRP
ncbi:hypothetical protein HRbin11_01262 [bacterium HR11]|nr:hypothetical protein HRbin11_01262 [bacterium HR11]